MGAIIKTFKTTDEAGSSTELVSADDLKTYLQIEGTAYDAVLEIFISAARHMIERMCSVSLFDKVAVAEIHNTGYKAFTLPWGPVASVDVVEWKKCPSEWVTLTTDEYSSDINYNATIESSEMGLHRITYMLGVDGRTVFAQAIKAQAGFMFTNRDAKNTGVANIAPEVTGLLSQFIPIL